MDGRPRPAAAPRSPLPVRAPGQCGTRARHAPKPSGRRQKAGAKLPAARQESWQAGTQQEIPERRRRRAGPDLAGPGSRAAVFVCPSPRRRVSAVLPGPISRPSVPAEGTPPEKDGVGPSAVLCVKRM